MKHTSSGIEEGAGEKLRDVMAELRGAHGLDQQEVLQKRVERGPQRQS